MSFITEKLKRGFEKKKKAQDILMFWKEQSGKNPEKEEVKNDAREVLEDHGSAKYNPRMYYY